MSERQKIADAYPLSAPGDFYVQNQMCITCMAPEHEAPDLIALDEPADGRCHCYFKRQPTSPSETEQAIRAVWVSCCEAVRYGGRDPMILDALKKMDRTDSCDYPS